MPMLAQKKAYLYMTVVVLLWSTVATAFKISLLYVDPVILLFYASLIAALILFVTLVVQNKIHILMNYTGKEFLFSALLGLISPYLFYLILFHGYDLLPAQVAMVLNFTWPITLTILSVPFLNQKIGFINYIAILISFSGVVIISTSGNRLSFGSINPFGIGLVLFSTVIWSTFWILNIRDKHNEIVKLFLSFSFGALYTGISIPFLTDFVIPKGEGFWGIIYVGLFEMGITYVVWLRALSLSSTTAQVSNLIFLIPFFSLVFIRIFLGEIIMISSIIGLIFIVSGIFLQQKYSTNQKK
jgi:drug/metabolite transporter (DMT)-like permease